MSKSPRVSVLTPIYNTNIGHLCECIDSILNQTFTDFEFIILNDSPNNKQLKKIIQTYDDDRIKYYENEKNMGISASRNRLLELARGEYIAIFDHDDISVPDRLERQVEFLDTHPNIGVVSGWLQFFGDRNDIWKTSQNSIVLKLELMENCSIAHTAAMIRKSVIDEHNIKYEEQYSPAEDYRLWTQLMDYTDFHTIQDTLVKYRWYQENTSNLQQQKMHNAWLMVKSDVCNKHPGYHIVYKEQQNNHEEKTITIIQKQKNWRMRLFGLIPFLKRKNNKVLLFDLIPIIKIKD